MKNVVKWILPFAALALLAGAFFLGRSSTPTPTNTPTPPAPDAATDVHPTASQPAAPMAAPTAAPTPTAPTATDVQSSANSSCPTTAEVKDLTGVDVQRLGTESCAWVWRGAPGVTTTAICPSGYVCTFDVVNDIVVFHLGVNQTATIRGGTWRFIDGYPSNDAVHNVCKLYHNEKAFGLSEVPSFEVRFQAAYDGSGALVGPATCP